MIIIEEINTKTDKIHHKRILLWWASCIEISHKRKREISERIEDIELLYDVEYLKSHPFLNVSDDEYLLLKNHKKNRDIDIVYENSIKKGIGLVTYFEQEYPDSLRQIHNPPFGIFYKGRMPDAHQLAVAMVGARRCSLYGETYAREYAKSLAAEGIPIVSGMALGIDGISQRSALDAGGSSFAIIGSGVDQCYPTQHKGLYHDLIDRGGVLSEFPPGTPPKPFHFPLRNRIISGLSDVLLVIEAKERSGSLITATMALEQGRDVYALPGPVNNQLSRGCNRLIKDGAGILLSPKDLFQDLGIISTLKNKNTSKKYLPLETSEKLVYSCLDLQAKNIQQIFDETKLPIQELISVLISLDLKGYVSEVSKNNYVKII